MSNGTMGDTPRSERLHIAIFGRRNAGKSSLINALTSQAIAIVSPVAGTTTDPVYKSMEIPPIGPVVLIDTAGIDDAGEIGKLRIKKTLEVLNQTDLLVLTMDAELETGDYETDLINQARARGLPVVGVLHKIDLHPDLAPQKLSESFGIPVLAVSSLTGQGLGRLKELIIDLAPKEHATRTILGDLVDAGDTVVLVTPIDQAAPKGRLILPQVQTIREILDRNACAYVMQDQDLPQALENLRRRPKLVITDAQVFDRVDQALPPEVPLTAFSVLFARYKGELATLVAGVAAVEQLQPGDKVLIAEACTHHRVDDDIGTVKIPQMLQRRVGGQLDLTWASGYTLPEALDGFKLIIHCGACMISRRQMLHRMTLAKNAGVAIVNYGVLIAYLRGILPRALTPFPTTEITAPSS